MKYDPNNKQHVFNRAVNGLSRQGFYRASRDYDGNCAYRGDDGSACFVGHLIPDSRYSEDLEELGVFDKALLKAIGARVRNNNDYSNFLMECQHAHDWALTPSEMKDRLLDIATRHGLEIPAELIDI